MELRQAGAPQDVEQAGSPSTAAPQMQASQPRGTKAPVPAAFGSGGGAALVFRDYASI